VVSVVWAGFGWTLSRACAAPTVTHGHFFGGNVSSNLQLCQVIGWIQRVRALALAVPLGAHAYVGWFSRSALGSNR
jgi:hypothetical protein